ncbi:hypothetical protein Hanom_Chr13g01232301 [Helianthus anomalus]
MDGLESEIRDVFITWHQYSFHTLKEYISLALKLDAHKLKDSFSPYDPNSSLYEPHKVFDIMSGNDNGETNEDRGEDSGKDSMESGQHEMGFSCQDSCVSKHVVKLFDEIPNRLRNEIQETMGEFNNRIDLAHIDFRKNENEYGSLNQDLIIQVFKETSKKVSNEKKVTLGPMFLCTSSKDQEKPKKNSTKESVPLDERDFGDYHAELISESKLEGTKFGV